MERPTGVCTPRICVPTAAAAASAGDAEIFLTVGVAKASALPAHTSADAIKARNRMLKVRLRANHHRTTLGSAQVLLIYHDDGRRSGT